MTKVYLLVGCNFDSGYIELNLPRVPNVGEEIIVNNCSWLHKGKISKVEYRITEPKIRLDFKSNPIHKSRLDKIIVHIEE